MTEPEPLAFFEPEEAHFGSIRRSPRTPRSHRLPGRRGDRRSRVSRGPAGEACARRGARRHRQDRACQVGRQGHGKPAHQAPVLRGPRRVQGALRVELQEAAPANPGPAGRRGWRREHWRGSSDGARRASRPGGRSKRTSSPRNSSSRGPCSRRSAPRIVSFCSSTRSTGWSSRPRPCLLEVLSEYQVSVPELGTVRATADPARLPDIQQHTRAVGGAQKALPLPAPRLPEPRTRASDSRGAGAGRHRGADRPGGEDRPFHQGARAEEGAFCLRDPRLGADPRRARASRRSTRTWRTRP